MAIDLGEKRIGIALSDPTRMLASAHSVIKRSSRKADFAQYQQIIAENDVTLVIMGLPLTLDGGDSPTTLWVRDYASQLATVITVPLQLADETYTTKQAHASMQARGMSDHRKRRERVDAVAAAFILQNYLDRRTAAP
jgi:putative Holliday junction resolvase